MPTHDRSLTATTEKRTTSAKLLTAMENALHIRRAVKAFKELTAAQIVVIMALMMAVIVGQGGQLITLNMWLQNFGKYQQPNPYTVLTLSALTIATSFGIAMLLRVILLRPNMRFLLSLKGLALIVAAGFCNATNGVFLVFASGPGRCPEILQALLLSTQIFWTLLASQFLLKEGRSYVSWAVLVAFLFSASGIILGASPQFKNTDHTFDMKMWSIIFAGSMIPRALYNVLATHYMRSFTSEDKDDLQKQKEKKLYAMLIADADDHNSSSKNAINNLDSEGANMKSDDATVKLTMLCTTGFSQVLWIFMYFPLDSIEWFSGRSSLAASREALSSGWKCVFDDSNCPDNYSFYLMFNASYFLAYLGAAYLNHYSAGLCSMVSQLSSPLTALLLVAVPAWNVDTATHSVGPAVGGAMFILVGSLIYASWEQGSREREEEAEHREEEHTTQHVFVHTSLSLDALDDKEMDKAWL